MHWKQSVQRIVSNHAVVSPEKAQRFLNLAYNMQRTTVNAVFDETIQNMLREFPNSRPWLQWWLQPSIASTILSCRFLMKESLRKHDSRTSNAIELYHSALYGLIPTKKPLATSLRLLLQVSRREGRVLNEIYTNGIAPCYGNKKRKSRKDDGNDGRAPDTTKIIFEELKKEEVKKKKKGERKS